MKQNKGAFWKYNLAELICKKRLWIVLIIEFIGLHAMLDQAAVSTLQYGEYLSVFEVFPFLLTSKSAIWMILFGWLLLVCDYPYRKDGYRYYMVRTNRKKWLREQMTFLILLSVSYLIAIFFIVNLTIFPYLKISFRWSLPIQRGVEDYYVLSKQGMVMINENIVCFLSPLEAFIKAFILETGLLLVVGLLFMLCNILSRRNIGYVVIAAFIIMDGMTEGIIWNPLYIKFQQYINPVTLGRSLGLESDYYTGVPECGYSICLLAIWMLCLYLFMGRKVKKVDL